MVGKKQLECIFVRNKIRRLRIEEKYILGSLKVINFISIDVADWNEKVCETLTGLVGARMK